MAVAAPERYFYFYKLKSTEELQKDVRKRPRIDPIVSVCDPSLWPNTTLADVFDSQEQAFEVDGTILRMEFLHPHTNDQSVVTLLLIVCNRGKSRLIWYEWDVMHPLSVLYVKIHSQVLPNDDRMPLLLIPMTKLTAFILVCENRITVYTDLFTGTPSRHIHNLSHRPEPEENGTSRRQPIWVQWARAMRSWIHRAQGDGIYLCREDGIVHFLTLKYDRPSLIDSNHQVGKLATSIDTSFAVLDVGPHSSDLLVVGGDGAEGGLWQFDARAHAKKVAGSPNWTPVVDMCAAEVVRKPDDLFSISYHKRGGDPRLISCIGRSHHGAISEIRYGFSASRLLALSIKDILDSGVLATWGFRGLQPATTYVLLSLPKQSYLVRIRLDDEDDENELVDIIEDSQLLGLKERTLSIKVTSQGRLIQVTERALWSTSVAAIDAIPDESDPNHHLHHAFDTAQILVSCIEPDGPQAITLIATRDTQKYHLHVAQVNDSYALICSMDITQQPTAVALKVVGPDILVFVGTSDGHLSIFRTRNLAGANDMHNVYGCSIGGEFIVTESIAVSMIAQDLNEAYVMLIAGGLRNGALCIFELNIPQDSNRESGPVAEMLRRQEPFFASRLKPCHTARLGDTPVEIVATTSHPTRFLAHCQGQMFNVECSYSKNLPNRTRIHRIYMTEDRDLEWQPSQFSAVAVVDDPVSSSGKSQAVELVCVDRGYVHIAALSYICGPSNIHRRVGVGGNAVKAVYSKRLQKLIVLSNRVEITRHARTFNGRTQRGKRTIRPIISFIDLAKSSDETLDEEDAMDVDADEDSDMVPSKNQPRLARQDACDTLSYEPGERYLGVTEWFPKLDNDEFHMLAVNTIIKAEGNKSATGRLLLFNIQIVEDHVTLVLKKETTHRAPVYAVVAHPEKNAVLFQCGEDVCILNLEASSTGPKTVVSVMAHLRSPARHITIRTPLVYFSTAGDSLAVFCESKTDNRLEYFFGDSVARQGLYHFHLYCKTNLVVTVDMGGSLTGFWQPSNSQPPKAPRIDNTLPTIFEACFPQSIVRLQEIVLPMFLKDGRSQSFDHDDPHEWLAGVRLLVGISTCGTITQHRLLSPHKWPLLRFLQNLAETSPIICPFFEGPRTHHLDPDRTTNSRTRAVNGDILVRLLERGGGDLLASLMNKLPDPNERFFDFEGPRERWERLFELYNQFDPTLRSELFKGETPAEYETHWVAEMLAAVWDMLQPAL